MNKRHMVTPAVWIFFMNEDREILLIRRHNTGWRDGWYTIPAGHVEAFESPTDCAIREANEEVNLTIAKKDLVLAHTTYYIADEKDHERVSFFFMATDFSGDANNNEPHKSDELCWASIDSLPKKTLPIVSHVIEMIDAKVTYSELDYPNTKALDW